MTSRTVLLTLLSALLACAPRAASGAKVGTLHRDPRLFYKKVEKFDMSDRACKSCIQAGDLQECTSEDDCKIEGATVPAGLYCHDFGGTAKQRCMPIQQLGASCTKATECISKKCTAFCFSDFLTLYCYQKCTA